GNDIIFAGDGNDEINAGDGADLIFAGSGKNIILGEGGNDKIFAGNDGDNIEGNYGDDEIFGGNGDDAINGGSGSDYIDGSAGVDLIFGGLGNDIIFAGDNFYKNQIFEYQNSIHGEIGDDFLIGSWQNDLISDGQGDDVIYGKSGDDKIILGEGNNLIIFDIGDGNDQIILSEFVDKNLIKKQQNSINITNYQNLDINSNDILLKKIGSDLEIKILSSENLQDSILIKNQFLDEFDPENIVIKNIILNDNSIIDLSKIKILSEGKIEYSLTTNFNSEILHNVSSIRGYDEQYNIVKDLQNFNFYDQESFTKNSQNNLGELEQINLEIFNEIQWLPLKKQRNILGGNYMVWREYQAPN
ncbi:MAG: calcium-binding protein, partial [Alphaproteobacteria bacterium]